MDKAMEQSAFVELEKAIHDENPQMRIKAIELIADEPKKETLKYLFQSLLYPVSCINAVHALAKLKEFTLSLVVQELASNTNQETRSYLLIALGLMEDKKVIDSLKSVVKDKEDNLRIHAITILNKYYYDDQLGNFFIELLSSETEREVKRQLIEALGYSKEKRAVPLLLSFLQQNDEYLNWKVALSLGEIGDEHAVQPLLEALNNGTPKLREWVAQALGNFTDNEAVITTLLQVLRTENVAIRQQAILALVKSRNPKITQALLAALNNNNPHIQSYIIEALGVLASVEALPMLKQLEKNLTLEIKAPLGTPLKNVVTIAIHRIEKRQGGSIENFEFLIR